MALGPLIILSGPAGVGKTTVITRLLQEPGGMPLRQSVSVTTRPPRDGEVDGVAYHFWARQRFLDQVAAGGFLEWAEVHDHHYGTLRGEVDDYRARGVGVILVIDVQGAAQVRRLYPDVIDVFLEPPSLAELERRLRGRGSESEATLQRRLANARRELERAGEYRYRLVSDNVERTVAGLRQIIAQHSREGGEPCWTN
jgi:guanylate kinase